MADCWEKKKALKIDEKKILQKIGVEYVGTELQETEKNGAGLLSDLA